MSNVLIQLAGLKGLRDYIKQVCEAHPGIIEFKSGQSLQDEATANNYPIAYLESDFLSETVKSGESFSINLIVADRLPKDATEESVIACMSKTDQMLSEIHQKLGAVSSIIKVSGIKKLNFRDQGKDDLATTRGEFSIEIPRMTAKKSTPFDGLTFESETGGGSCAPVTITDQYAVSSPIIVASGGTYVTADAPDVEIKDIYFGNVTLRPGDFYETSPAPQVEIYDQFAEPQTVMVEPGGYYEAVTPPNVIITDALAPGGPTFSVAPGGSYSAYVQAHTLELNFNFDKDATLDQTITITSANAGSITSETNTNCSSLLYYRNGSSVLVPFTLSAGNTLKVAIVRATSGVDSTVKISGTAA